MAETYLRHKLRSVTFLSLCTSFIALFIPQSATVEAQAFNYPHGIHLRAGIYAGLPLLSTNGDYVNGYIPTPPPGISLEGNYELNSNIFLGYDFGKWSVALEHRFHRYRPDSFFTGALNRLGNPTVFNHHDIGLIVGRNFISKNARLHQIGLGYTVNNIGSSFLGYDANQPGVFPATINLEYNSFSFRYARQLLRPSLLMGPRWYHHFMLQFSTDFAPEIALQSVVTSHSFFRFGFGLQYQFSGLWQPPVVKVNKEKVIRPKPVKEQTSTRLKLIAGLRVELPISAFASNINWYDPPSDFDFEYNQFTIAPTVGVRYYAKNNRMAYTYVPGLKKTVLNYSHIPPDFEGGQISAVMRYGTWVVDQHFDFQWFSNGLQPDTKKKKARRTLGVGFSVMNPFASYIETNIPAVAGKEISLMYFTFNAFAGFELGKRGWGKGFFIEPRLMFVPRMPDFSVSENKLRVMSGLRLYKEIHIGSSKNKE